MAPNRKTTSKKPNISELMIRLANECPNPLLAIDHSWQTFSGANITASIACHRWPQLERMCQNWMIDLTEHNMKDYYESSDWRWSRDNKLKEFRHSTSRILLMRGRLDDRHADSQADDEWLAFVNFRFELGADASESALYCYELQVRPAMKRRGIGRYLMACLDEMGKQFRVNKVMLTVLKRNADALQFYVNALHFRVDKSSPSRFGQHSDYEILSKKVEKKL